MTRRIFVSLLITIFVLGSGCAAPYVHHDAILSASTAEFQGSQIDKDAVMLTITVPFRSLFNPQHNTFTLEDIVKRKERD